MYRSLPLLVALSGGCAGLLGIEDLAGESDGVVDVSVSIDRVAAEGIDVIGHRVDGSVSDHQLTDASGAAAVAIPRGGLVSVLVEVAPSRYELRTWADLRDGDRLRVDVDVDEPSLAAAIILSNQNTGGLASWRVSFSSFSTSGSGGLGAPLPEIEMISRHNVGDDQTVTAVARLRNGGIAEATAHVIDAPITGDSVTLEFSNWSRNQGNGALDIDADLGIDGLLVVGEVRGRQFFAGEDLVLDAGAALADSVLIDRQVADLVGLSVLGPGGSLVQTDYIDGQSRSVELSLERLDEIAGASAVRDPVSVSWAVEEGGDTDTVLATVELFDLAVPDRQLIWRVEADPRHGEIAMPAFPDELAISPRHFTGFTSGWLEAFASSAHDGYRALRTGEVALAGHMSSTEPVLDVAGRVRSQTVALPLPLP